MSDELEDGPLRHDWVLWVVIPVTIAEATSIQAGARKTFRKLDVGDASVVRSGALVCATCHRPATRLTDLDGECGGEETR